MTHLVQPCMLSSRCVASYGRSFRSAEDKLSLETQICNPPLKWPGISDPGLAIYLQMSPCFFDSKGTETNICRIFLDLRMSQMINKTVPVGEAVLPGNRWIHPGLYFIFLMLNIVTQATGFYTCLITIFSTALLNVTKHTATGTTQEHHIRVIQREVNVC